MSKLFALLAVLLVATACGAADVDPAVDDADGPAVTVLLAGDLSLARAVGEVALHDPDSVFAGVRHIVRTADLAAVNLESPFTRAHPVAELPLVADPRRAALVAASGFDLAGIANNHAGDAGPTTVVDSISALQAAGVVAVGGGPDATGAFAPAVFDVDGVSVGFLAFDATGYGPPARSDAPGVAAWGAEAEAAVVSLRAQVDVLVVGVHGGAEYLGVADSTMRQIGDSLSDLNVDVVWGHGAHVVQPISTLDPDEDGRVTVVATSLGNFLFDQQLPGTDEGAMLQVLAGSDGVRAFRIGEVTIEAGRVGFERWSTPPGDAALIAGEWWSLMSDRRPVASSAQEVDFDHGDLVASSQGDIDGDGTAELVVSFRRPFEDAALHGLLPDVQWQDASGRSAHIGVFDAQSIEPEWIASAVARPVADIAACDLAIAVRYSTLDDPAIVGLGGWAWNGFGWDEAADLDGGGTIGCADVDGDGLLDPVVGERHVRADDGL